MGNGVAVKTVDRKHRRKWFDNKCSNCGSRNITPVEKQAKGKEDWCSYVCEDCHKEFGPVKYAESY